MKKHEIVIAEEDFAERVVEISVTVKEEDGDYYIQTGGPEDWSWTEVSESFVGTIEGQI